YPNFEVIVVDNGSTDGSRAVVQALADPAAARATPRLPPGRLRLVRLARNLGYARGKNAGVRRARGKYLWLLDADVRPAPDSLTRLVEFFEHAGDPRRLAMPLLLDEDTGRVRNAGLAFTFHGPPARAAALRWPAGGGPYAIHAATGGVLFITRQFWDELGGFAREGFLHLDDVDLGARAQIAGGSAWCVPAARAWHPPYDAAGEAPGAHRMKQGWAFRNGPVFILRNFQWPTTAWMLPACFGVHAALALKWAIGHRDWRPLTYFAAAWMRLPCALPAILRARRSIQSARRRPDRAFLYTPNFWRV
ncbi:MAG: glycosyltransferase, partial [bacterium]|nr:glycosyltransferase [bacterium]